MQNHAVELNNVIYNAANQCFEALATVYVGSTKRSFPCAINAPIGMSFEDAAKGLSTQAMRRSGTGLSLSSTQLATPTQPQVRAGRTPAPQAPDAFDMLRHLAA